MMTAYFNTEELWHKAIAAAVREGLTFEAWEFGMSSHVWCINYTGGY